MRRNRETIGVTLKPQDGKGPDITIDAIGAANPRVRVSHPQWLEVAMVLFLALGLMRKENWMFMALAIGSFLYIQRVDMRPWHWAASALIVGLLGWLIYWPR